jgi:hypothetical protein
MRAPPLSHLACSLVLHGDLLVGSRRQESLPPRIDLARTTTTRAWRAESVLSSAKIASQLTTVWGPVRCCLLSQRLAKDLRGPRIVRPAQQPRVGGPAELRVTTAH